MKLAPEIKDIGKKFKTQINGIEASIRKYKKIAIFRHIMPDFDALGTQMGLYYFLKDWINTYILFFK